jgi:hypothetical protein
METDKQGEMLSEMKKQTQLLYKIWERLDGKRQ